MRDTRGTPLVKPWESASQHDQSYLRQIGRGWTPAHADEAKHFAIECFLRAGELTSILVDHAQENQTPLEVVR